MPEGQLGDVLMVLEFVNSFSNILHLTDFFPFGISFELIERALTREEVAGPLVDLIQMLLCTIFKMQDDEFDKISFEYFYVSRRKYSHPLYAVFNCVCSASSVKCEECMTRN